MIIGKDKAEISNFSTLKKGLISFILFYNKEFSLIYVGKKKPVISILQLVIKLKKKLIYCYQTKKK